MKWLKFEKEIKKHIRELDFDDYNIIIKAEYKMIAMRLIDCSDSNEVSYNVGVRILEFIQELK